MDRERLRKIYDKTNGNCHICHRAVAFSNYGATWEVEHSKPRVKGGTDHLNNLYPAHISCNRSKGERHTKTARSEYGHTRAPYSARKIEKIKNKSTAIGAVVGGFIGAFLGPEGVIIGASIGVAIARSSSPEK